MKADCRKHARRRVRGRPRLQAQQGRLARRPLGGPARPRDDDEDPRRGETGVAVDDAARRSAASSPRCPTASTSTRRSQRLLDSAPQDDRDRRGHRLGDRRGAGLRLAAAGRLSRAPVGPGLRARHLLAAPLGADRSGDREALHAAQPSARRTRRSSRSSTRCCRKRPCSASSMATRWPSRMR